MARVSIPNITRVRVRRGVSMKTGSVNPTPEEPRVFRVVSNSLVTLEGGARSKMQIATTELGNAAEIPFAVDVAGLSDAATRGVDFVIENAAGVALTRDVFSVPAGQLRGEVFIRALADGVTEGVERFRVRLVENNGSDEITEGNAISTIRETVVSIEEPAAPARVGWEDFDLTAEEPGLGETSALSFTAILSKAVPAEVRVPVTVGEIVQGDVEEGQDFELPADEIVFAANELTAEFAVSILHRPGFQGGRAFRLVMGAPTGGAEQLEGATAAMARIDEPDPVGDGVVRFSPNHNGNVTVVEGAAKPVELRVEFVDGIPYSHDVLIDWEIQEVAGSGISLGVEITTSAPIPITIPAGQTFALIPIQAPELSGSNPPRGFKVVLTGVGGGKSSLAAGLAAEILGRLLDTSEPLPTIGWTGQNNLAIVEGTTATKRLELSAPAANPIEVSFNRSGTAGTDDLSFAGDLGSVTIPAGETSLPVEFTAHADSFDESGETALIEIAGSDDYINDASGQPAVLTVSITDVPAGGTTLEFNENPGSDVQYIDVCTGFDPFDPLDPPKRKINGVLADVFPIDPGRADGLAYAAQVVCAVTTDGGQATMEVADGTEPRGPGYRTDNLDDLWVQLQTHSENLATQLPAHVGFLRDAVHVETTKDGHYLREDTYMIRPKLGPGIEPRHEYCLQVMLFVRRTPWAIMVKGLVLNEAYENLASRGHFDFASDRNELDGTVHFSAIRIHPPAGLRIEADTIRQRCTTDGINLIADAPKPHRLPPQRRFAFDIGIFRGGENFDSNAHATGVMDWAGVAIAADGPEAYDKRFWFGPRRASVPKWGAGYRHPSGQTGGAASRSWAEDYYNRVVAAVRGEAPLLQDWWWRREDMPGSLERTWFEPAGSDWSYNPGGNMIHLRNGIDHTVKMMRALDLHGRHIIQANASGLTDVATGQPLTVEDLAGTNGLPPGVAGAFPWLVFRLNGRCHQRPMWFVPLSAAPQIDQGDRHALRPTDRHWNVPPAGGIAQGLKVEPTGQPTLNTDQAFTPGVGDAAYSFQQPDIDHFCRYDEYFQTLAWMRNCERAKWIMRSNAAHITRVFPHAPIRGQHTFPGDDVAYNIQRQDQTLVGSLLAELETATGRSTSEQGGMGWPPGITAGGSGGLSRHRGHGHSTGTVAGAAAVTKPGPLRNSFGAWFGLWLANYQQICTTWGGGERFSFKDFVGNEIPRYLIYAQDIPWMGEDTPPENGIFPWVNPVPVFSCVGQGFKQAFGASRMIDAYQVFLSSSQYDEVKKWAEGLFLAVMRTPPEGGRPADSAIASVYMHYSHGTGGQTDPPGSAPVPYILTPGVSTAVPGVGNNMYPFLVEEWGYLFGGTLQLAHQRGDTTLRDEVVEHMKRHFGLSSAASKGALVTRIEEHISGFNENPSVRWASTSYSDLIGALQLIP